MNDSAPAERVFVTQLTPLLFLERAAEVFPDRNAVSYGDRRQSYAELGSAAQRLAGALAAAGIGPDDRVAYLLPNLPQMLVAHFGVPLARAVLVAINTRLSGPEVTYILRHSGSKMLVADTELLATAAPDLRECPELERVIALDDVGAGFPDGSTPYAEFIATGVGAESRWRVDDEQRVISINYTSGTTGRPKGVMYTHRGAYLNALAEVVHSRHDTDSVYLWTLPMFHCNGWCTPWAVTAVGGRHVCLRAVEPELIWRLLDEEGVTHFNAAPTVLVLLSSHPQARPFARPVTVTTAGAPPSPTIGDLAVSHADGYIELRDRAKDIIISGGENISTIEVEQAILTHQSVLECAVVAIPQETWGERPKAFVVLRDGAEPDPHQLIEHVRSQIAHFKAPDEIEFIDALPKTSTGKVQKHTLRQRNPATHEKLIN